MRVLLSLLITSVMVNQVYALSGKCSALGRTGGESERCAVYDNTDEETCKKADGHAWCFWEPLAPSKVKGTGPIQVECLTEEGQKLIYKTNRLYFNGREGSLFAIGFGSQRQDDGFEKLIGNCEIKRSSSR